MTEYRCRYCHEPIPPALAQSAIYRRQTPTFCRRSHNTLHKQRKRRFEAKGLAGDEIAKALATPPNLRPARKVAPPRNELPQRERKSGEPPTYAELLRARKTGRTLDLAPQPSPKIAVAAVAPTQGPGQSEEDAALADLYRLIGGGA